MVLTWHREHVSAHLPANWIGIDLRGCLCGATTKWAEWIQPAGIARPVSGIVREAY